MTPRTVVVIGHVDHGKTALVRALTGMETDRLKEERERGLSIALGFAHRDFPLSSLDFIDAPGHEDFVRAMVTGATGARGVLLVVSAVEGLQRQSHEHLQIAALLGLTAGVVAVSKSDLLAPDRQLPCRTELEAILESTAMRGQPIIFCSGRTGAGLETLAEALEALALRLPRQPPLPGLFLPIDRAFSVPGMGTVVTGTLLGGALRLGDSAVLQPDGRQTTVRSLQIRGQDCVAVEPGRRAAVGLRGVPLEAVKAGDVLCAPGHFAASQQVDAQVSIVAGTASPLKAMDQVRLILGTRSFIVKARPLGGRAIAPGDAALAQLCAPISMVAFAGQRGILRRLSPAETLGGVLILDPAATPVRGRAGGRIAVLSAAASGDTTATALALAARDKGVAALADLRRLTQSAPFNFDDFCRLDDDLIAPSEKVEQATQAYRAALAQAHRTYPARFGAPLGILRQGLSAAFATALVSYVERYLVAEGEIVITGGFAALADHDPVLALSPAQRLELQRIEAQLRDGGASPPAPEGDPDLVDLLIDSGRAVALRNHALRQTVFFHTAALTAVREGLAAAFPPPTPFTTGEAREALLTSRKFIVPLLEAFDARGWTLRTGDSRQLT